MISCGIIGSSIDVSWLPLYSIAADALNPEAEWVLWVRKYKVLSTVASVIPFKGQHVHQIINLL